MQGGVCGSGRAQNFETCCVHTMAAPTLVSPSSGLSAQLAQWLQGGALERSKSKRRGREVWGESKRKCGLFNDCKIGAALGESESKHTGCEVWGT
jgi:hypothetical protein